MINEECFEIYSCSPVCLHGVVLKDRQVSDIYKSSTNKKSTPIL